MYVGCNLRGFGASTMTLQHCSGLAYINFLKIHPHLHKHNSVRVDPYAHPQLIKVLKHFVYMKCMWDAIYVDLEPQP